MKASVVIPVKNGGALLERVLQSVALQRTPWPFETLAIDSGSRDGSQARVRGAGMRLHEIAAYEFGHGRTRNLAFALSQGEFVVFITQDALPADEHWLARLVGAAQLSPDCAGAFGRHLAYPDCNPVTARELEGLFRGFGEQPNCVRLEDWERYRNEPGYRQFLHFFSNNNACIRRAAWEEIPFPEVDFAEDQLWARAVIEAGYAKAYAPDACVYHSHNFGVVETYRRAFDEARAFQRGFGYQPVPDVKVLWAQYRFLLKRDWGWTKAAPRSRLERSAWLAKLPLLDAARLIGTYAGGQQAHLPDWLIERFSRDKSLQRS